MAATRRQIWKSMVFSGFLLLLVAFAVGSVNAIHLAAFLAMIMASIAALNWIFPGSRFFTISFTNFLALYACIFNFFMTTNFTSVSGWLASIGFILPVAGFLLGAWVKRRGIRTIVQAKQLSSERVFTGATRWLWPVSLVGAMTFLLPDSGLPAEAIVPVFLVAMLAIAGIVLLVSKDVATFLLDSGLLFEAFFQRVENLVLPAFAFLTFYSMNVVVFGCIYRILDHYTLTHHFLIEGQARELTFMEGLYFSIITLSTVGYGDIVPVSHAARVIVAIQIVISVMLLLFGFSEIMSYSRERRNGGSG